MVRKSPPVISHLCISLFILYIFIALFWDSIISCILGTLYIFEELSYFHYWEMAIFIPGDINTAKPAFHCLAFAC